MRQTIGRRAVLGTGLAAGAGLAMPRIARAADQTIRIGVLTDMAGTYAFLTGTGSVLATQFAIDDFAKSRIRNVQGQGQRSDADAHGLDVVLQQNFARVDRTHAIFEHVALQCCSVVRGPSRIQCGSSIRTS